MTAALGVLLSLVLTGCPWWSSIRPPDLSAEALSSDDPTGEEPEGSATEPAEESDVIALLSAENWIREVAAPGDSSAPEFRWRHPSVEELTADLPDAQAVLRRHVASEDRLVSANAAIALGRRGDPSSIDKLAAVINDRQMKLPTRCAAAEALGRVPGAGAERLRELAKRYEYEPEKRRRYVAEIHAELIRGLARRADAADRPRLMAALRSPSGEVQRETLAAWQTDQAGELPAEAVDLRTSRDPQVRAALLGVLATRRPPEAEKHLLRALDDFDIPVRAAAIAGLGTLGGDTARVALKRQLDDRAELIRVAVVPALADAGDRETVFECVSDKSWRVRLAVAKVLSRYPDERGVLLARKLLDDPSTSIGPQVIESVASWPLELAGPVLLEAMGKQIYLVRKQGSEQLALRWPPAQEFSHEAPPERRREILEQLNRRFRQELGGPRDALAQPDRAAPGSHRPSQGQLDEIARLLEPLDDGAAGPMGREEAVGKLVAMGPGLVDLLEQAGPRRNRPLPESVYCDVLPQCSSVFSALDRFDSEDTSLRRRAAAELVEMTSRKPLPRLALTRLAALAAAEEDALVWRSVLLAMAADGREPTIRLAAYAIGHPSPEIRRRACEHLAAHPDPAHARILLPALSDSSVTVILAATTALGAAGRLEHPEAVQRLLGHPNLAVQLEAAHVLALAGVASGTAGLERLALCGDPAIRREVAVALGEVADPSSTATLIHMLDDGHGVRRAALESLAKVTGRDVAAPGVGPAPSIGQQVDAWKRWYEQHRNRVSDRGRPDRVK